MIMDSSILAVMVYIVDRLCYSNSSILAIRVYVMNRLCYLNGLFLCVCPLRVQRCSDNCPFFG